MALLETRQDSNQGVAEMILKFKGWHKELKEWVQLAGFPDPVAAQDYIIVLWTGFSDENNEPIYDGDVLEGKVGKRKVRHVVEHFMELDRDSVGILSALYLGEFELSNRCVHAHVIGNVNEGEWAWTPQEKEYANSNI